MNDIVAVGRSVRLRPQCSAPVLGIDPGAPTRSAQGTSAPYVTPATAEAGIVEDPP